MRSRLGVLVLLVAVALVAGCSGSSGASGSKPAGSTATSTPAKPFTGADFYAVPKPLPAGRHGTLIRYQPVDDLQIDGAKAYRVMYLSRSVAGAAIAVTGTVLVPSTAAPSGGRRVLTVAHGTTGIADDCAPSKHPRGSELALMAPFVGQNYLIAATDYEGLGTPGRHPYLVGESEGRGVLDAARAAAQLPGADAGKKTAIFGYSQGGHGALWAGQLAESWTPELDLVGTVAGAPATEFPIIFGAANSPAAAGFAMEIIAGFNAAYPQAKLDQVLTPAGITQLPAVDKGCGFQVIGHFISMAGHGLVKPDANKVEPWAKLEKDDNPGNVATNSPILIIHSAADDVVPAVLSQITFGRMCKEGQVVERRVYNKGQGHVAAVPDAVKDGFTWIQQRFAGRPARSTCPASPGG